MTILQNKPSLKKGLIVYIITFILAALVSIYRAFTGKDFMDSTVLKSKFLYKITAEYENISWWPISHFIMYVVLGIIAPEYWLLWFCIGIGWELLEWGGGKILSASGRDNLVRSRDSRTQYGDNWVAGSITDVICNGAGLGLGVLLSKLIHKSNKHKQESYKKSNYKIVYSY